MKETAAYLQLCERTVTDRAVRGDLPGVRIGSVWRFARDRIKALFYA